MSDEKPQKRDRFLKLFKKTGLGSRGTGKSSMHTSTAASSAASEASLSKATAPSTTAPVASTHHLITPTESLLKHKPRDAIGDVTSKSDPTSQPAPKSTAAAAMDTAPTRVENEREQHISTAARSLWGRAINSDELSQQDRKTLADTSPGVSGREMASNVDAVRCIMNGILKEKGQQWKVKFGGEEVVLRDVGMQILRWVDTFKEIGDTIVQYDPVHAALPWAGVRFLLQVDLNR